MVGVYTGAMLNFPLGDLFDKQITLRWGQSNVRAWTDGLYDLLRDGDVLDAASLVTHRSARSALPTSTRFPCLPAACISPDYRRGRKIIGLRGSAERASDHR